MNADTRDKAIEPRPLRLDDHPASEKAELPVVFRRVKPRGPLHELAVQRIRRGLEQRIGPARSRRQRWTRAVLAAAASLFLIGTFAALAVSAWPALRHSVMRTLPAVPPGVVRPVPTERAENR